MQSDTTQYLFGSTEATFHVHVSALFFFWHSKTATVHEQQPQLLTKSPANSVSVHCSWTHKLYFPTTFSLKIGLMALFIHLKIILLQYFQFSVFNFGKISSIQTDPQCKLIMHANYDWRQNLSQFIIFLIEAAASLRQGFCN